MTKKFYIIISILIISISTKLHSQQNFGLDFSHHIQNINWKVIYADKPMFIIHKATEGSSFTDKKYLERKNIAAKLEIPFGAYHFFSYKSSGSKQALHFMNTAQLKSGNIIPVVDIEFSKFMPEINCWIKEVESFIATIQKHLKVTPIIYCEEEFYNKYLKGKFANVKFWIANYQHEPTCDYEIWQYSKTGKIYGLNGLDLNKINPKLSVNQFYKYYCLP